MIDGIPFLSQFKSLGQAIIGDAEGAKKTQENFTRQCPVVAQARSAAEALMGDMDAAEETQKEFAKGVSNFADHIPVVGAVKGVIHHAAGDTDGRNNAARGQLRLIGGITGAAVGV